MKYSTLVIAALLVGCGSESQNPFQIAADEPEQAVQTQEQITQPVQTVQPTVEPAPVTSQPVVVTQPEPVQPVPQEPVETPICEGTGTGWGWENNASCIYAQVVVQPQIEIEPVVEPEPEPEPEIMTPESIDDLIGIELDCVIYGEQDSLSAHTLLFSSDGTVIRKDVSGSVSETTWIRNETGGISLQNGLPLFVIDGKLSSGNFDGWEYTCDMSQ